MYSKVELLADVLHELDWLVGRDYTYANLAMMHVTRELAKVPEKSLPPNKAGYEVDRYIVKSIHTMVGHYELIGRRYEAIPIRVALRLQLGKNMGDLNLPDRQPYIMKELGRYYSEPTWRKNGYRLALLALLAEHMVRPNDQISK